MRVAKQASAQEGAIAIIVAAAMVALLLLVALAVDLGGLYSHDRELQTAADAGALAGAQELILAQDDSGLDPATVAVDYVNANVDASKVEGANLAAWAPDVGANYVQVDLREDHVAFSFARAAGRTEGSVVAHARAEIKYVTGLDELFPVALLTMNPDHFRFVIRDGGGNQVGYFDLRDGDEDGVYDVGGTNFHPPGAGLFSIDLEACNKDDEVGLVLPGIGLFRAADPSDAKEKVYRVGLSLSAGGTLTVRVETSAAVTDATLAAHLGSAFTLTQQSAGVYVGSVAAPSAGKAKDGYATFDLTVNKLDKGSLARFVAFNPDVPIRSVVLTPSPSAYSCLVGESSYMTAVIRTRNFAFGEEFVLKLGNQAGSGLYSGNWRLADIWSNVNTADEIGEVNPPDSWTLNVPLYIDGPLVPETGAKVGQVIDGLDTRTGYNSAPADDPCRVVVVPIVDWDIDLAGTSRNYTIRRFAAFRITDYSSNGNNKGDCVGEFIHWAIPGTSWSDDPPGPIYVQTAVLTQ